MFSAGGIEDLQQYRVVKPYKNLEKNGLSVNKLSKKILTFLSLNIPMNISFISKDESICMPWFTVEEAAGGYANILAQGVDSVQDFWY